MPTKTKPTTRSAPAPAPSSIVSETALADFLDVGDRRVRQLADEGIAKRNGPASYDLAETIRAISREGVAKCQNRVKVCAVGRAFAEALASAREEQINNPKRDPLAVLEGDFLSLLRAC